MDQSLDLVFFGIQGSGKGTQARMLAEEFGFTIFEAGGVLRGIVATGSALGKTVASYIDNGKLVPNDIMMAAVEEAVTALGKNERILFDGIPRYEEQMHSFNAMMQRAGRDFRCIHLMLPEEIAIERIKSRGEKEGRIDDQDEDRIRTRLGWYHEQTEPVIDVYRKNGKMIDVDGLGSMEEVYSRMKAAVESMEKVAV